MIESDTCLKPMVTERAAQLLRLHSHYKAGHLLVAGGVYDQPNYYLEAMAHLDALAAESEQE